MSVRDKVKSLSFHSADEQMGGLFGEEYEGLIAKFRLEMDGHGFLAGVAQSSPSEEPYIDWDCPPIGDKQFIEDLERFVLMAFSQSVRTEVVVDPVDLDAVARDYESEYGEELEDEEER